MARQTNDYITLGHSCNSKEFFCDICGDLLEDEFYEFETERMCEWCFDRNVKNYYKRDIQSILNEDLE